MQNKIAYSTLTEDTLGSYHPQNYIFENSVAAGIWGKPTTMISALLKISGKEISELSI